MIEEANDSNDGGFGECSDTSLGLCGVEVLIKVRISTSNRDMKLPVRTLDTIFAAKRRIHTLEGIDPANQRWFFGGRLLHDKMTIDEAKIPAGFIVQVIVTQPDGKISPSVES